MLQERVRGGGSGSGETVNDENEKKEVLSLDEWYKDVVVFCVRYLGFTSCGQVDALTIPEFEMLREGALLREADREYYAHLNAYATFQARARKKTGKDKFEYVFKNFKKFYNRDQRIKEITGKREKEKEKEVDRLAAYKQYLKRKEREREGGFDG